MLTNLLTLTITAYCHCAVCCGEAGQPTASGVRPMVGRTVAASRSLPFGTVMIIPGVGKRVVQDRLAKRYDNRVDIFVATHAQAKKFGKQIKQVKVITK